MQWVTDHNVSIRYVYVFSWCLGVVVMRTSEGSLWLQVSSSSTEDCFFGPGVLVVVHLGPYVWTFPDSRCACRFSGLESCGGMAVSRVASLSSDIHYAWIIVPVTLDESDHVSSRFSWRRDFVISVQTHRRIAVDTDGVPVVLTGVVAQRVERPTV